MIDSSLNNITLYIPITYEVSGADIELFGQTYTMSGSKIVIQDVLDIESFYNSSNNTAWLKYKQGDQENDFTAFVKDIASAQSIKSDILASLCINDGTTYNPTLKGSNKLDCSAIFVNVDSNWYKYHSLQDFVLSYFANNILGHPGALAAISNDSSIRSKVTSDFPVALDELETIAEDKCKVIVQQIMNQDLARFNLDEKNVYQPVKFRSGDKVILQIALKDNTYSLKSPAGSPTNVVGGVTLAQSASASVDSTPVKNTPDYYLLEFTISSLLETLAREFTVDYAKIINSMGTIWSSDVDTDGNAYITINTIFPSNDISYTRLGNSNNTAAYVSKINLSGETVWSSIIESAGYEYGQQIKVDISKNVYLTGTFYTNTITINGITYTSSENGSAFLIKFDPNGNVLWVRILDGISYSEGYCLSIDKNTGSVCIGGSVTGNATFIIQETNYTSPPTDCPYIIKFTANGDVTFVKFIQNSGSGGFNTMITIDSNSNIYTSGTTRGDISFNGVVYSAPSTDGSSFLLKTDGNGNTLWVKIIDSIGLDTMYAISLHNQSYIITNAHFIGNSDLTISGIVHTNPYPSLTTQRANVIIQFNLDGTYSILQWIYSPNSSLFIGSCVTDPSGNIYVYGHTNSNLSISGVIYTHPTNTDDSFILILTPAGSVIQINWISGSQAQEFSVYGGLSYVNNSLYIPVIAYSDSITLFGTTLNSTNGKGILVKLS